MMPTERFRIILDAPPFKDKFGYDWPADQRLRWFLKDARRKYGLHIVDHVQLPPLDTENTREEK